MSDDRWADLRAYLADEHGMRSYDEARGYGSRIDTEDFADLLAERDAYREAIAAHRNEFTCCGGDHVAVAADRAAADARLWAALEGGEP